MTSHNAANERIKPHYFTYLAEALGHSEQTIDAVAKAISRFEAYTRFRDFKAFHIEQAKRFKHSLSAQRGSRSGEPLSKATLYATLTAERGRRFVRNVRRSFPGFKAAKGLRAWHDGKSARTPPAGKKRPAAIAPIARFRRLAVEVARPASNQTAARG